MTKTKVIGPSVGLADVISEENQNSYNLSGNCPADSSSVTVLYLDATLATGSCENGEYRLTIDFSSFMDGSINLNIKTNQGGSASFTLIKDTQAPSAAFGLIDSTYFLSTTSTPVLSWSECTDQGLGINPSSYQIQVFNSSDNTVVKAWSQATSGESLQGLNLIVGGSYYFQVRCADLAGNISISSNSDGWTVPSIMSLNPSTLISVLTGETFNFSSSGGAPDYSYSDNGTGFINSTTGVYSVPIDAMSGDDTVSILDSVGQTAQTPVHIQNFQTSKLISSTVSGIQSVVFRSLYEFDGALYGVGDAVVTIRSINTPISSAAIVLKSTDFGATWNTLSQFQSIPSLSTGGYALASINTDLYLLANSNGQLNIAKSQDKGSTWSTVFTYTNATGEDIHTTVDGQLLIAGSSTVGTNKNTLLLRCSVSTWVCNNMESYTKDNRAYYKRIKEDGSGNIYVVGSWQNNADGTGSTFVKKSTDNGQTWNILRDNNFSFDQSYGLSVSSDGLSIVWVGRSGASTPVFEESVDGGSTWTRPVSPCSGAGAWTNTDVLLNSAKDTLLTCNDPLTPKTYIFRRPFGGAWSQTTNYANSGGFLTQLSDGSVLNYLNYLYSSSNFGSSWNTQTMPTAPTLLDANLTSVLGVGTDTLYAVGANGTGSSYLSATGVVYESTDSGGTWSSIYTAPTASANTMNAIAKSPTTGTILTAGDSDASWKIYKKGSPWTVTTYTPPSSTWAFLPSLIASADGTFYATGSFFASAVRNWHTRISTNDGSSWSTLDTYQYVAGKYSAGIASAVDASGNFFSAGYGLDAVNKFHWLVRKYNGSIWSLEDDEIFSATAINILPQSIHISSDGFIYVAGFYMEGSTYYWVVKKRALTGGTWAIDDSFALSPSKSAVAYSITEDSTGRLFVSGYANDALNIQNSVVRMKRPGGTSWAIVDQFLSTGGYSQGQWMAPCLVNRMCLVGSGQDSTMQLQGFVRILSP